MPVSLAAFRFEAVRCPEIHTARILVGAIEAYGRDHGYPHREDMEEVFLTIPMVEDIIECIVQKHDGVPRPLVNNVTTFFQGVDPAQNAINIATRTRGYLVEGRRKSFEALDAHRAQLLEEARNLFFLVRWWKTWWTIRRECDAQRRRIAEVFG